MDVMVLATATPGAEHKSGRKSSQDQVLSTA